MKPFVYILFAVAAGVLSGCAHPTNRMVSTAGMDLGAPTALVIVNPIGDVRVLSSVKTTETSVHARIDVRGFPSERRRAAENVIIDSEIVNSPVGRVLRVEVPDQSAVVDLTIRVPAIRGGANVRAAVGAVSLTGVSGDIDVVNGSEGSPAGRVVVRTGRALEGNVSLVGHGKGVVLLVPAPLNADVAVYAPGEEAIAQDFAGSGIVRDVAYGGDWYRAKYNGARYGVTLRALGGDARLLVLDNPESYWP